VSQRHYSSSQQRKKGNKPGPAQLGHQSSQQRRSSRDPESRSRNQQQPDIEAATPKVIKIIVGERTVLEGVLNTGSVLTVQTREGAEPQSIELLIEDLTR